jgi:hypothetical protein
MLGMVRLKNGWRRLVCDTLHIGYITAIAVSCKGMYRDGTYRDDDFGRRGPLYGEPNQFEQGYGFSLK